MFNGVVHFSAAIKGNGLTFPRFDFNPNVANVDKVTIEGRDGAEIQSSVHLVKVPTANDGKRIARQVNTDALNRIAFHHGIAIHSARHTGDQFIPVNPGAGPGVVAAAVQLYIHVADHAVLGIGADDLRPRLEQANPPGGRHYGLFRSALRSTSPVEAYMHLYNILLMLYNDVQADVDAFILREDPAVPRTQHPKKRPGVLETVYSRLRNEFGHVRPGVDIESTKAEMEGRLAGLVVLVRTAIRANP